MTRKRTGREAVVPLPPRCLRPKLTPDQVRDLSLCHHVNVDAIARGEGTEDILWDLAGGALTWSRVADNLQIGSEEMHAQLEMLTQLIERYGRTGRVVFTGPELQLAREGLQVMDQLAALVDRPTAIEAAEWSERKVNKMAERCLQSRPAQ